MTRTHRVLAALITLVAVASLLVVAAVTHAAPAPRPAASPLAASSADDSHLVRVAQLRANRAEHRRALAAYTRKVAAARARAAAAALARARAAAARAARHAVTSLAGVTAVWIALVGCEASGDWQYGGPNGHTDPGYDFEGGPNFAHSTWLSYRLPGYPLHAYDATPLQQVTVARRVLRSQGVRAWPVCGPRVGLQPGD